jgi:hypothetical protein
MEWTQSHCMNHYQIGPMAEENVAHGYGKPPWGILANVSSKPISHASPLSPNQGVA